MADNPVTSRKRKDNKTSGKSRANQQAKREAAQARAEAYAKLTVQQKIARLDAAFGVGLGAARERARLAKPAAPVAAKEPEAKV